MTITIDKSKERKIKDLALFINNKPESEKQPLYSILLGAGASFSSGIKTGQHLVEQWLRKIYQNYNNQNGNITTNEIRTYLKNNCQEWYNPDNEYASLFGKIYDLPSQRRNFIEREVGNANEPSIGYRYLNRLAAEEIIDTFFTTNFDDLLEQAMSPFNDIKRPIVCAHDSSIFNISVRSNRTKIIKLHGDFLFKNLKSSSNEVEKLDKNTKDKFEEFLKIYGLIVVGYAGNDNSIMDVLIDLVKKDEYLNNGIYWCIKKSDFEENKLSPKLKELLTYNKAYYILIDDFDTFAAELTHLSLGQETVQIGTQLSARQSKETNFLTSQKEKYSNCNYIVNDINYFLERNNPSNKIDNISTYEENIDKKQNEYKNEFIAPEEQDIRLLIKNKQYAEAIEIIDKNININNMPSFLYNRFMDYKIACYIDLEKKDEAIKNLNTIIAYNETNKKDSNIPYLVKKANLVSSYDDKLELLETAYSKDKSDYNILNSIAECKIGKGTINDSIYEEINQIYDKSISIENTSDNDAYLDKLYFVSKFSNKPEEVTKTCDQIINDLGEKDLYSHVVFKAKIEKIYREIKNGANTDENKIRELKDIFDIYIENNYIYERNVYYVVEYMKILSKLNKKDFLEELFKNFDTKYDDSIIYIVQKARCAINNFYNVDMAMKIMENIDSRILKVLGRERIRYYSLYLRLLLIKKEYNKAIKIINKQPDAKTLMQLDTYMDNLYYHDKDKFLEKTISDFEKSNKTTDDYISYTYNLLKLEEYDEIYETYQKQINNVSNTNVDKTNPIIIINYSLAKKQKKIPSKIRENNLEDILKQKEETLEKAAAQILLGDISSATKILKKKIDEEYMMYYRLQIMPVFKPINFSEFKKEEIIFS